MRTEEEVQEILNTAHKEIQEICTKHCVDIDINDGHIAIRHHQKGDNGEWSIKSRVSYFAPF